MPRLRGLCSSGVVSCRKAAGERENTSPVTLVDGDAPVLYLLCISNNKYNVVNESQAKSF
jgi:hypothetical protein